METPLAELRRLLTDLYGEEGEPLAERVTALLPEHPLAAPPPPPGGWITYITYPDAFFADSPPGTCFAELTRQLPRIRALGCQALHILPLFASPGIDMGFDVSDFLLPDPRHGSAAELEELLEQARRQGLAVILDLILNHVSTEHPWFRQALRGGDRSRFFTSRERPELLEFETAPGLGRFARYRLGEQTFCQRVIFPDQCDPQLPHWQQVRGEDGEAWYYYHTFYPQQVDLDWRSPGLFADFAAILVHWASRGVSFRLDAVPFIGRDVLAGDHRAGTAGSTEQTHTIVRALRQVLLATSPGSIFLVEASESPERVRRYLDPAEAQAAYDFRSTMALWATLAQGRPALLADHLPRPAEGGFLLVPLRTHDGILMEAGPAGVREAVLAGLLRRELWPDPATRVLWDGPAGTDHDVPGRSLSLLGGDPRRLLQAYFLAACLPGSPMLYYGDELGLGNDVEFMLKQLELKRRRGAAVAPDLRELNRGPVRRADLDTPLARELSRELAGIFSRRPQLCATEQPEPVAGLPEGVLGLQWRQGELVALVNLRPVAQQVQEADPADRLVCPAPGVQQQEQGLTLPGFGYVWVERRREQATEAGPTGACPGIGLPDGRSEARSTCRVHPDGRSEARSTCPVHPD